MDQLLTTKLYIPRLGVNLVSRPRLYERLDKGLTRKLTLVSAPTGFGKSTLVTGWLAERGLQAAWLSLDQGDNDPVRFWTYLIAAIQTIHQEIGVEARQIVSVPQLRSIEPVAISLINDISQLARDLIVVLDEYHVIEAEQVQSLAHTRDDVVPAVERLAALESVGGEDLLLLSTAAYYHGLGFVEQMEVLGQPMTNEEWYAGQLALL